MCPFQGTISKGKLEDPTRDFSDVIVGIQPVVKNASKACEETKTVQPTPRSGLHSLGLGRCQRLLRGFLVSPSLQGADGFQGWLGYVGPPFFSQKNDNDSILVYIKQWIYIYIIYIYIYIFVCANKEPHVLFRQKKEQNLMGLTTIELDGIKNDRVDFFRGKHPAGNKRSTERHFVSFFPLVPGMIQKQWCQVIRTRDLQHLLGNNLLFLSIWVENLLILAGSKNKL